MKLRDKNPLLKKLIIQLKSRQAPVWKAAAKALNRPKRARFEVSLFQLDRHVQPKETIVIPGIVLSDGDVSKPLTVGAYRFTATARQKIENAGGTCLTLEQCAEKYPDGKGLRLMG